MTRQGNRMKWATGVTVAPRKNPTFDKCYQSFLDSGFKPHVFKEPGVSIHPDFLINGVTERMYTLGAWKNWLLGLRELRTSKPNADIYGMFQDDALFCKNVKPYLEKVLWPSSDASVVSIYTPRPYASNNKWSHGMLPLWGAVAYFFLPETLDSLLNHPIIRRTQPHEGDKLIDVRVGEWSDAINKAAIFHNPSLVEHIGEFSTIWDGDVPAEDDRAAFEFVGENFDALQLLDGVYTY